MKGDFTRNTFDPAKHYRDVLLQQGRAQVDADWNEQAALTARRDETTAADIVGDCGGPADGAAFGVITATAQLSALEQQHLKDLKIPALGPGDFYLSAGRYYVDGIQCENEWPLPFTAQPDRLDVGPLVKNKTYLLYLDVWQRHITALEDSSIRESALGGPDTATRVKTICQVHALDLGAAIDPNNPCNSGSAAFKNLFDPGTALLTADTATTQTPRDPCLVPPSAGFTGLENQLYRVEIHDSAKWKWSRENGSVVTRILEIDKTKIKVASLGPDKNLGFVKDAWVEILDDALELEGNPGQLAQIDDVDEATHIVTLKSAVSSLVPPTLSATSYPNGVVPERSPKLRRWEGVVTPLKLGIRLPLESGVEVTFAGKGNYRTGHYWQIPARTATAQSPNGEIEWPENKSNRLALAPRGITHHFCRLGILTVKNDGSIDAIDCRCLWPALTHVPRLFYVSGDGQEVMPDLVEFKDRVPLAEPLIVGVVNLHANSKVRFTITKGNGQIEGGGQSKTGLKEFIDVQPTDGQARCVFSLETASHHQQVTATALDPDCGGTPLPIIFNANLSIASEVAYNPDGCSGLQEQKTVQDALSRLAAMVSLYKVSGDGQEGTAGEELPQPLVVMAANRCGVATGLEVKFNVVTGGGTVAPVSDPTSAVAPIGLASCKWTLGPGAGTQELEATLVSNDPLRPVTEPSAVRFTANLRAHGSECCCVTVGPGGQFERLDEALKQLLGTEKRTDICICLMPGDHKVTEDIVIKGRGKVGAEIATCVRIAGCGVTTRLWVENKRFLAVDLASFALSDLCILAVKGQVVTPITLGGCSFVSITGCYLAQLQGPDRNDLITIESADRIVLADNMIYSLWSQEPRTKFLGLETPTRFESGGFDSLILEAAGKLASGGEKAQREFVKAFRGTTPKKTTDDPRAKIVDGLLERIDTIKIEGRDKSEAIATFRDVILQLVTAPAVVIADATADVSITNNIIVGEVRIYGTGSALSEEELENLATRIHKPAKPPGLILDSASTRSLRIEGNSLTNVVVSRDIVPAEGASTLKGLFARMSLLDNSFQAQGSEWLALHVISNGNYFMASPEAIRRIQLMATAVAASFICVGTSARWIASTLQYAVPPGDAIFPASTFFSQSANLFISFKPL